MDAIPIGGRVLLWRKGKYVYAIIYIHAEHGGRELAKHAGKEVEGIVVVKGKKEIDAMTVAPSSAEPQPKHDPMNEPYNAFIYQLYRRLAKIRAEHDLCNSPYAKLIDGRQYVALKLAFENPLYSDRRVTVSESLTIRDVKSVTRTRSRLTMRYSVTEAKQILEHFAVPAEVRLLGKNYYILIECERAEEVFTALRSIVASNISDTAI